MFPTSEFLVSSYQVEIYNFNSSCGWNKLCWWLGIIREIICMCWLKVLFLNFEERVSHLNYELAKYKIVFPAYHHYSSTGFLKIFCIGSLFSFFMCIFHWFRAIKISLLDLSNVIIFILVCFGRVQSPRTRLWKWLKF